MEGAPKEIRATEVLKSSQEGSGGRFFFLLITIALLLVVAGGLFWIFAISTGSPVGLGWFLFAFATGLSMIVLPCTLPLAFVIVPLSMGKGYAKGFATAISFSAGVALTLSLYGILAALMGKAVFSFSGGGGETVKNVFYALAGIFAIVFALGELGFVKARMPSYSGAVPSFIQRRKDLLRSFFMGLFLGNIGVGCPHPATPIILGQIGIVRDVFYGWLLFFVHALGRVVPLLVLAMLGIIGINATRALVRHKDAIARATAWGMVFVGGFLFTLGFFGHDWWVYSGSHSLFETVAQEQRFTGILAERFEVEAPHIHGTEELEGKTGFFGAPLWLGNWVLVALWVIPMWWYWLRVRSKVKGMPIGEARSYEKRIVVLKKWLFLSLTALFGIIFIYLIPHWFLVHKQLGEHGEEEIPIEKMGSDEHVHPPETPPHED